ncbi:MAG: DUF2459 domain-containing protein [Capsulimonadales bacterium]|nr:DUF2459 domain-containing protein [Capsulimonadales bacterium]
MVPSPSGRSAGRPIRFGRRLGCAAALLLFFLVPAVRIRLLTEPPGVVALPPVPSGKTQYDLYVIAYGYHTAIFLEQPDGWRLGPPGNESADFLEYGWGDRRFYGFNDQSIPAMLTAAFWGTPSVVYVGGEEGFPPAKRTIRAAYYRTVTAEQLRLLLTGLEQAMTRAASGERPPPLPPRTDLKGRFFPAREYYILWSDCNRWTVERLREVGLARTGVGVVVPEQVGGRLIGFRRVR